MVRTNGSKFQTNESELVIPNRSKLQTSPYSQNLEASLETEIDPRINNLESKGEENAFELETKIYFRVEGAILKGGAGGKYKNPVRTAARRDGET